MKLYTILRNLIQGIKNALQEAKGYTDTEISAVDARLDVVEQFGTLVDSIQKQGKNQTITIPHTSTWRFMLVTAYVVVSSRNIVYQSVISSIQTFADSSFFIGGYYVASNDKGICNVNLYLQEAGGTISLRNFTYANSDYSSTAYLQVRFFK